MSGSSRRPSSNVHHQGRTQNKRPCKWWDTTDNYRLCWRCQDSASDSGLHAERNREHFYSQQHLRVLPNQHGSARHHWKLGGLFYQRLVLDIAVNGDSGAVINSAKHKTLANGSGSSSNVASQGLSVSVANGSSGYSSFSTTITQGNSGYSGGQSSGSWNVIRENAGSGTGTWTARVLTNSTNLSGSCDGKALTVTRNGTTEVNLGNSGGSWGPIACSPGDVLVWTCSGGIGGGGTINRSQSWAWSGSPNIQYTANTNGGTSGSVVAKTISVTNSNSKSLQVTLSRQRLG